MRTITRKPLAIATMVVSIVALTGLYFFLRGDEPATEGGTSTAIPSPSEEISKPPPTVSPSSQLLPSTPWQGEQELPTAVRKFEEAYHSLEWSNTAEQRRMELMPYAAEPTPHIPVSFVDSLDLSFGTSNADKALMKGRLRVQATVVKNGIHAHYEGQNVAYVDTFLEAEVIAPDGHVTSSSEPETHRTWVRQHGTWRVAGNTEFR